jgi:hypothetical protein
MSYRPQFYYRTPPGYRDIPYVRPVVYGQDPSAGVPSLQPVNNYIIQLDKDADILFRSLFIQGVNQGQAAAILQVRLTDAYGNYLTDGYIPMPLYAWGAGLTSPDAGSGRAKVFEPELYCPAGSVLQLDFYNPVSAVYNYPGLIEFRGVKRCPEACAA